MSNQILAIDQLPIELELPPIKVGQDYSFTIEILDDNEAPQDTTDWDMEIKGKTSVNGTEVFDLTTSDGITHTPASGRFVVKLTSAKTAEFKVSSIAWDCKITDGNGDFNYPFQGTFTVLGTVTL